MVRNGKIKELTEFLSDIIESKIIRLDTNNIDELNVLNIAKDTIKWIKKDI